jgi:hypothetical protein
MGETENERNMIRRGLLLKQQEGKISSSRERDTEYQDDSESEYPYLYNGPGPAPFFPSRFSREDREQREPLLLVRLDQVCINIRNKTDV